jgi:Fe-S cluster assembly protein SufD
VQPILTHYLNEFNTTYKGLETNKHPVMHQRQQAALDYLLAHGLPNAKSEKWRYIGRSPFLVQPFKVVGLHTVDEALAVQLPKPSSPDTVRFVYVNGQFSPLLSSTHLPQGLSRDSTTRILKENPESLPNFDLYPLHQLENGFTALNTAFLQDGCFLKIGKGYTIQPIIELWYVYHPTTLKLHAPLFCLQNVIQLEQNSSATILERSVVIDASSTLQPLTSQTHCFNIINTISLQAQANLTWAKANGPANHQALVHQAVIQQDKGSHFKGEALMLSGGLNHQNTSINLLGKEASCVLNGLSSAKQNHLIDQQVSIYHQAEHTQSELNYYAIADERSRIAFAGEITVEKGIQRIQSNQTSRNLLLSNEAEIDTRPRLALFADDIQCTHGATIGQLDTEALFYLQSRGIPQVIAAAILQQAFTYKVWQSMPILLKQPALQSDFQQF